MTPFNTQAAANVMVFGLVNEFRYRSHDGTTTMRRFIPHCIRFGSTEYHPDPQWLVEGYDVRREEFRTYALKDFLPNLTVTNGPEVG